MPGYTSVGATPMQCNLRRSKFAQVPLLLSALLLVSVAHAAVPTISSISPATITAGAADTGIAIIGSNFSHSSYVLLNGYHLATTYVSGSKLTAIVPAPQLAGPNTYGVRVYRPGFFGGLSNVVTLTVQPVPPAILQITTLTLPAITLGVFYSTTLSASGGIVPYAWSLPCGALPTGLTLSSAGIISGTPTVPGDFSFVVAVTDSEKKPSPYPSTDNSVPIDCTKLLASPATIAKRRKPGVFAIGVAAK